MEEFGSCAISTPRASGKGTDPLIGRVINERYRIVSVIARGGMGKVYRAEQSPLGRQVALKVLDPAHSGEQDPEFHQRFFLEASLTSKLTHPNTVTIFDYGKTDDDVYYIAMELLEGRTLHLALREDGPFAPERTIHVAAQVARALREAHGLGVIHRDLKPANVFLVRHGDETDHVKVLDFGLVKNVQERSDDQLTKTGVFLGSPKYMAPEQIRGEVLDARSDVYALGVLMFEMLTGKAPFHKPTSLNTLMAHLHDPIPRLSDCHPSVHAPEVEEVVRKCLAKDTEQRYADMNEVLASLKELEGGSRRHGAELSTAEMEEHALRPAKPSLTPTGSSAAQVLSSMSQPLSGSAPFAHATKARGSSASLIVAGVFALTGIGGFAALSGNLPLGVAPGARAQAAQSAAEAAELTSYPAPSAQAPHRAVLVSLRSTPPGATVLIDDKEYGPTPTHALLSGAAAELGREVTFVFRQRGYRELSLVRRLEGTRLQVDAGRMEPVSARRSASREAPVHSAAPLPPGDAIP